MDQLLRALIGPLIAASIAALSYVAKLFVDMFIQWRQRVHERRNKLIALRSLLLASRSLFTVQISIAKKQLDSFEAQGSALIATGNSDSTHARLAGIAVGYDAVFANLIHTANADQQIRHSLIRQYTISGLAPLNRMMLEWLRNDSYYKIPPARSRRKLAYALQTLEAHLVIWLAKYDCWIPDHPERTLVFLNDEHHHGIGFPTGIEELVEKELGNS